MCVSQAAPAQQGASRLHVNYTSPQQREKRPQGDELLSSNWCTQVLGHGKQSVCGGIVCECLAPAQPSSRTHAITSMMCSEET